MKPPFPCKWRGPTSHMLACALVMLAAAAPLGAQVAVAVDFPDRLITVDLSRPSQPILRSIGIGGPTIDTHYAFGLARHPGSGKLFALVSVEGMWLPRLMTLDPCVGTATETGSLPVYLEALAFDASGTLWAVTDSVELVYPDSLFRVDTSDGEVTFVTDLGGVAESGEAIAYNPIDGLLYRLSGWIDSANRVFETVDLETLERTGIVLKGDDFVSANGLAHLADGRFVVGEPWHFWSLTADGIVKSLADGDYVPYGIVIVEDGEARGTTLVAVSSDAPILRRVDAQNGSTIWCVAITMAGWNVTGATGIAQDPVDRALYALLTVSETTTTQLAVVDLLTGEATRIGDTRSRLEEITFLGGKHGSTLYGVSADGAPTSPEWLFTIERDDATLTPVMALGDGTDGESISFHSLDGQIYHASGVGVPDVDRVFERIDVVAATVADVPLSGALYSEATAMAYLASGDLVLADSTDRLYTITQSGEVTFVADLDTSVSGLVLLRRGVGENVCIATPSSTGAPASMSAFGSDRARPGDALTLTAEPVPDQTGLFFFGPSERQIPFGLGYLCVGGGVTRVFPPVRASGRTVSVAVLGSAFVPGETTYFQYWFRDPAAGGAAFNTSDALRVTFKF